MSHLDMIDAAADLRRRLTGLYGIVGQLIDCVQIPGTSPAWEQFNVYDRLATDLFERVLQDAQQLETALKTNQ